MDLSWNFKVTSLTLITVRDVTLKLNSNPSPFHIYIDITKKQVYKAFHEGCNGYFVKKKRTRVWFLSVSVKNLKGFPKKFSRMRYLVN